MNKVGLESNSVKIALFDLDHVFVTTNSTFKFVEFYAIRNFTLWKNIKFTCARLFYFVGAGFIKKDKRDVWIGFLSGESIGKVGNAAHSFCDKKLSHEIDSGVLYYFNDLKSKRYRTILISASIDPVVSAFAAHFHFDDWFSGVLSTKEDIYTGTFEEDLKGEKHGMLSLIEDKYGKINLSDSYFFTDNQEDIILAKKIGNSYGVIRGNFENIFWERNGIKTMPATSNDRIKPRRYIIPLTYFLFVRNASLTDKHLWFFYIGFPMFSLAVFEMFSVQNMLWMVVSLIGFYSIYEIGYLINDFVSIKKEKTPTLRVNPNESFSKSWFIINRIALFVVVCLILFLFARNYAIWLYILANILTAGIFEVHNLISGTWRQATLPLLKISHLLVPLVLFPGVNLLIAFIMISIVYLPGHIFIYHRKIINKEAPGRHEMIGVVVLPTCIIMLVLLSLNLAGSLPWTYSLLGLWLSVGHLIKILKLASNKAKAIAA